MQSKYIVDQKLAHVVEECGELMAAVIEDGGQIARKALEGRE